MNVQTILVTENVLHTLEALDMKGQLAMRKGDAEECIAQGLLPFAAIRESVYNSVESYVVLIDNRIVAIWGFGVSSLLGECCYPWILTTDEIEAHKVRYARGSKRIVEYLLSRFPRLQVMVDCRYMRAIGWLEWLGFDAHPSAVLVGDAKLPFLVMTIQNETFKEMAPWDR